MSATTCPVCGGKGSVPNGFYSQGPTVTTSSVPFEQCRSCDGKGIVWPPNTYYPIMPPMIPMPQWNPPSSPFDPPYRITCTYKGPL